MTISREPAPTRKTPRRYDLANALARLGTVDTGQRVSRPASGMTKPLMKANPTSPTIATRLALAWEYAGHRLESLGQTAAARQYRQSLEEALRVAVHKSLQPVQRLHRRKTLRHTCIRLSPFLDRGEELTIL